MIRTAQEYALAVSTFDHDQAVKGQAMLDEAIGRIPYNINRAGTHYRKLVKKIYGNRPERKTKVRLV